MNDIIKAIENEQLKSDITDFNVGETVKVYAKVIEGSRERIQVYEGTVLKRQNGGARETFTVRKLSNGVGVEKTWPLHSPIIDKIEVVPVSYTHLGQTYGGKCIAGAGWRPIS